MNSTVKEDLLASSETQATTIPVDSPEWNENAAALKRICSVAKERNVQVRLVIAPYLPSYRRNITNWDRMTEALSECAGDVKIADYSRALTDISDFADRMHLNHRGAESFRVILEKDRFFSLDGGEPR